MVYMLVHKILDRRLSHLQLLSNLYANWSKFTLSTGMADTCRLHSDENGGHLENKT